MISNYDHDNSETSSRSQQRDLHRKKRRKLDDVATTSSTSSQRSNQSNNNHHVRWRTSAEQQTYSSKLITALRQVRSRTATVTPTTTISGSRAVREAADKALAVAARGRTRWSRAILTNRIKLRLKNHKKVKVRAKVPPPAAAVVQPITAENSSRPPIEKRVKVLGRLVPGCRKLSFPNLLEEATDYIAALQMQVRTMAALAELLSGSSSSASAAAGGSMDIEPANSNSSNNNDGDNPVH